jgi:hypothetical protein
MRRKLEIAAGPLPPDQETVAQLRDEVETIGQMIHNLQIQKGRLILKIHMSLAGTDGAEIMEIKLHNLEEPT